MPHIILPRNPKYACRLCNKRFFEEDEIAWVRHVRQCRLDHEEQVQQMLHKRKYPLGEGDVEAEKWMEKHRTEIIEGRKTDVYGKRQDWRKS